MRDLASSIDGTHLKAKPRKAVLLDTPDFIALLDVAFRSSISTKPMRVSAGIKCLSGQDTPRLCVVAPASFARDYTKRLEEQATFVPGISKWLSAFLSRSPECSSYGPGSENISNPTKLQSHLWMTAANGVRNHEHDRKLKPLQFSQAKGSSRVLDDANTDMTLQTQRTPSDRINHCHETSSYSYIEDDNLFDIGLDVTGQANVSSGDIPYVTLSSNNANASASGFYDAPSSDFDEPGIADVGLECDIINEAPASPVGTPDQNRSCTTSPSPANNVSMILCLEEPREQHTTSGKPVTIGGPSWLTQNVIRLHPLRQHDQQLYLVDQTDHCRKGCGLYHGPDVGWSESHANGEFRGKGESEPSYTTSKLARTNTSFVNLSEQELLLDSHDAEYDASETVILEDWPMTMPTELKGSSSSTSLADVIGNDHLLWHMWKRRASVAPRGEEDILDMRTMYETDPDMKLLGGGWDLDLSDISSGSNEDPMLQHDVASQPTPRQKHDQASVPTSEKRPYFPAMRSSSSSSYVGRSTSEPKPQRRGSIMKRFSWGGRQYTSDPPGLEMTTMNERTMEVKRRKTLNDYEMMDREIMDDDSSDMLF